MANHVYIFLVTFALVALVQGQTFPDLPDSFSTEIEINIKSSKTSMIVKEWFDYDSNAVAISVTGVSWTFTEWILENQKKSYMYFKNNSMPEPTCKTTDVSDKDRLAHDYVDMDNGHLFHTKDLFTKSLTGPPTYVGKATVRGITCDHFSGNIADTVTGKDGNKMAFNGTMEFYFSTPDWKDANDDPSQPVVKPVRLSVNVKGAGKDTDMDYEFFAFNPGKPDPSALIPAAICNAGIPGGATPAPTPVPGGGMPIPSLPNDFSMELSASIVEKGYTIHAKEIYDYSNNRLRLDSHKNGASMTELFFLDKGVHFSFDTTGTCNRSSIDRAGRFTDPRTGGLRKTADLFQLTKLNNTYTGVQSVRGIQCNSWVSTYQGPFPPSPATGSPLSQAQVSYTLTWYFAVATWSFRGETVHSNPIRAHLVGTDTRKGVTTSFNHVYDFVDFHTRDPGNLEFNPPTSCEGASDFILDDEGNPIGGGGGGGSGSGGKVAVAVILSLLLGGGVMAAAGFMIGRWHAAKTRSSGTSFESVGGPPELNSQGMGGNPTIQQPPVHGGTLNQE
eukprot:TRINITY_DN5679_c0_g1_i1.p1 TRINITY_DN5679_c0_g1~~TRINITY_DN5679_c0_g1_i1.p1  ORF type:complete len:559 (+),score=121.72 TRINITY_DN5679_c0_g1_i1:245-1921(+)